MYNRSADRYLDFKKDYPQAKAFLVGGVDRREYVDDIEVWPITEFLQNLPSLFAV